MNELILLLAVLLPLVAGIVCLLVRKAGIKEGISLGVSGLIFILSIFLFVMTRFQPLEWEYSWLSSMNIHFSLRCDGFSAMILFFLSLFTLLICLYSLRFMRKYPRLKEYYAYYLWFLAISWGAVLANNLVVFLLFWGILGLLLYGFLSLGSYKLATRGIFTVGAADFALILGGLFLFKLSGTLNMNGISGINLQGVFPLICFILLVTGVIAKIGSFPFHTWIPHASEKVPLPIMAYVPASLDKLLGVYLLFRICSDFFNFTAISSGSFFLMIIGVFTIVLAVMMALVSSDMRKIIAYLNISAGGYILMGMATANPVGMAGGLFYLLSTTAWTSLLFLTAGSVQNRNENFGFSLSGDTAKGMPLTFAGCLIGGLAISGVPPLNGFFSKWMIYQSIVELNNLRGIGNLWIIWLTAAVFGSVVTLASFMRMFYSVFLAPAYTRSESKKSKKVEEMGFTMGFPMVFLAAMCLVFGIFAYQLPLKFFIAPFTPGMSAVQIWIGWWEPTLATILIILGLLGGVGIYFLGKVQIAREDSSYIGGEQIREEMMVSETGFSDTITNFIGLRRIYRATEKGLIDIYEGMLHFSRGVAYSLLAVDRITDYLWRGIAWAVVLCGKGASLAHNGILHTYLAWFLLGLVILILIFCL